MATFTPDLLANIEAVLRQCHELAAAAGKHILCTDINTVLQCSRQVVFVEQKSIENDALFNDQMKAAGWGTQQHTPYHEHWHHINRFKPRNTLQC